MLIRDGDAWAVGCRWLWWWWWWWVVEEELMVVGVGVGGGVGDARASDGGRGGKENGARRDVRDALGRIGRGISERHFQDEMRLWNASKAARRVESRRLAPLDLLSRPRGRQLTDGQPDRGRPELLLWVLCAGRSTRRRPIQPSAVYIHAPTRWLQHWANDYRESGSFFK